MSESHLDYLLQRADELAEEFEQINKDDWFYWAGKAKAVLEQLAAEVRRKEQQK